MDLKVQDFNKICRCCLSLFENDKDNLQSLKSSLNLTTQKISHPEHETDSNTVSLSHLFQVCTSIKVFEEDGLPNQICTKCVLNTVSNYSFRNQAVASHNILLAIIENNTSEEKDEDLTADLSEIEDEESNNTIDIEFSDSESVPEVKPKNNNKVTIFITKETSSDLFKDPDLPKICSICNETLPNAQQLTKHRQKMHGKAKFQCIECGKGFTTTRGLRIHLRIHANLKPEICSICGKGFADPRTKRNHEKMHAGDYPFSCDLCDKKFPARNPLKAHLRTHTGDRPYKCNVCSKSYYQANSLQIHFRTHSADKPFICPETNCWKAFTSKAGLDYHQLNHSGIKKFLCMICGKQMARKNELTVHTRTHTGVKPYSCKFCDKSFTNSSALKAHMPVHTTEKNFICCECGKSFARKIELDIHNRCHTGEKKYSCSICNMRFSTSSNLRLHERKHTGETPFSCLICDKPFSNLSVLNRHYRTHDGFKPFSCNICEYSAAQKSALKKHMDCHRNDSIKPCKQKSFDLIPSVPEEITDSNCLESVELDLQPSLQESIFGSEVPELSIFITPDDADETSSFELSDI